MEKLYTHLQITILTIMFVFAVTQKANASAKAGEASVYEGRTVTVSLADAYKRTLMRSTGVTYRWYSENSSYATVTSSTCYNATIKGVSATSSCKIYFQCSYFIDGYYRTMDFYYTITVLSSSISVTMVSLNQSSISLKEGKTYQLSATVYPTNATNKNVTWSTSNSSVATVSTSGFVSAKSEGTTTITCRASDGSGKYSTCKVTVEAETVYVTSITLNKTFVSLNVGETVQLNASISPSTATNKNVSWYSGNTSVATVSSNGYVTAKSSGTATITCKASDNSGKIATCSVVVKEIVQPTSITLDKTRASLAVGETLQLTATVEPSEVEDKTVTWISDNTAVATVSNNGLITAKNAGTTNIIATTSNNLAAVCVVTVETNTDGELVPWSGHYKVSSSHVENNPTKEYPDDFEITIEKKNGMFYITSMFGDDMTQYNNGGFKLQDNGDGTASIDVSYYNVLKYTNNDSPLYAIYVFDENTDDWSDTWILKKNEDGSIALGDFYVAAFSWNETDEKWTDGKLEALYYRLTATREDDASGISNTNVEMPKFYIDHGTIRMDKAVKVTVYRDNGMIVFSGNTDTVQDLSKGLYIVRIGNQNRKILIK